MLGAIAALGRAGLVALDPVADHYGHRGCGYRLYLPHGVELRILVTTTASSRGCLAAVPATETLLSDGTTIVEQPRRSLMSNRTMSC